MDTGEKHSRKNPVEAANLLSLLFFGWTAPIFWKGARRDLQITDLYDPLKRNESEGLGDRLENEWKKELAKGNKELNLGKVLDKKPSRKPNLLWAITRMLWVPYMLLGLFLFIQCVILQITVPILQGWIISYFDPSQNLMTKNQVLLYAGFLIVANLGFILITHHTNLGTQQIGMRIRVACCSMIYRKVLRLDQTTANNSAAGQVANLISNDVARFDEVLMHLHHTWIMPIQLTLIGYILWRSVGPAAMVGIGAMIIQAIPIQGYLSTIGAKLRSKIAAKTDERVQLMSEMISGIQVVKMCSWEKPFELIVSKVRALEMKFIRRTSYLRGINESIIMFSDQISVYLTLITFFLMGNSITPEITFVIMSLFNVLKETCSIYFSVALVMAGEACVSLKRITEFLLQDEVRCSKNIQSSTVNELQDEDKTKRDQEIEHRVGIEMVNVSANWVRDKLPSTLHNVSIDIRSQSLCALVGPVGSGKSSLLHLLLGELSVETGRLSFFTDETIKTSIPGQETRISYASQDPWLFPSTIRDNILFGQLYNERRYREVTRVCALLEDFEQLPQGDLSYVGERGASLSGGQRARVNLARAVYRDADLYLLDDPFSAVDPPVGRHLFKECILRFLKGKTRIIVTHQLQYLREADKVVVLNRGTVEFQGTYEELPNANSKILKPVDPHEPDKVELGGEIHEQKPECKNTAVTAAENDQPSKVINSNEGLGDMDEEEVATGDISSKVYQGYFLAGGNSCSLAFLTAIFITGQIAYSGTNYWIMYWTNQEALRAASQTNNSYANIMSFDNNTKNESQEMNFIESLWFDVHGLLRPNLGIYIHTICFIGCILFVVLRSVLFTRMCMNASQNIHDSILANLFQTTMRFFNTNPSGRILNRFSKDMGSIDEILPRVLLVTLQIFTAMIGIFALVTLTNYIMIVPVVSMCGLFYVIRNYYLKTAQDLKRLEGITKSPMFSHASSTLDGLTTIRSRGASAEQLLRKEFDRHQDAHTGAWFLTIATATAFGFILDLISCGFIACVCFTFILMDDGDTLGGFVGLAISQSMLLTGTVEYGIRQSTELISHMTSVERIFQYTNLPKEGPFTTENPPPPTWPPNGGLVFKDVTMKYADNKPLSLKNLNVNIKPGWKVGIVGRTGAGKSSLISALFRLTGDGLDGGIFIDGIDTKSIGLHELRPRISIIPQEPTLFSASLRHNLDPFEQYSDAELWESLQEVELGDVVPSLDFQVAGGGANFSVGQRQLLCLARAILRNNRLLVLDEATANVDHNTDALIQNTIRRRFRHCTVLTIAHRLNTIMDSDRVLVMSQGRIVEFGHPHLLLKNRDGHLSKMVLQTGKAMAENLTGIAQSAYLLSPEFRKESVTEQITHL